MKQTVNGVLQSLVYIDDTGSCYHKISEPSIIYRAHDIHGHGAANRKPWHVARHAAPRVSDAQNNEEQEHGDDDLDQHSAERAELVSRLERREHTAV